MISQSKDILKIEDLADNTKFKLPTIKKILRAFNHQWLITYY